MKYDFASIQMLKFGAPLATHLRWTRGILLIAQKNLPNTKIRPTTAFGANSNCSYLETVTWTRDSQLKLA